MTLSRTLRLLLGIGLSVVLAVVVNVIIPSSNSLRFSQKLSIILLVFTVGLASGWLLQRRWAIIGIPLIYILSVWVIRLSTCTQCVGPIAGIGILRASYYGLLGLSPMVFGAWLGISRAFGPNEKRVGSPLILTSTLPVENPGKDESDTNSL